MFDTIRSWLSAATQLPSALPPKVRPGHRSFLSFLTTTKPSDSTLAKNDRRLATTDITTFRAGASTSKVIRDFVASSPDLSAAVFAYLRVGITKGYTVVAMNPDGTFNPEATNLAQQITQRMDYMPDYSTGFSGTWSLRSVSEALAKELVMEGACSSELVLDKTRLPSRIQPLAVANISFYPDGDILKPVQKVGGEEIDLDIPTFFYTALDQDLLNPYASSMLEPAIKAVIFSEEFIKDLQRVAKRAVHPRLYIKLVEEQIRKGMPSEAQHDQDKLNAYLNSVMSDVEQKINGLNPEDALVMFDSIQADVLNNGNISIGQEWSTLSDIVNSKLSTGAKTMPAILGHGVGSQNVASSESMLFVKNAAGAVQLKLNEHYSRLFTLAVRLFGHDVVVEFKYDDIDLRPEAELESFRQTKQSRVLELLSLGLITDDEASLTLTGRLPPAGYKPLSGTMFQSKKAENPDNKDGTSNDGSTLNQKQKSDQPSQSRGQNNKANPVKQTADVVPLQHRI